jgi:predicted nucleotidyltransferase
MTGRFRHLYFGNFGNRVRQTAVNEYFMYGPEQEQARKFSPGAEMSPADEFVYSQTGLQPSSRIQDYLNALTALHLSGTSPLVSILLFGSAAKGAFVAETSDVDLIIVVRDDTSPEARRQIRQEVSDLEIAHDFQLAASRPRSPLEKFAERAAGHAMSCFVCSRSDLLSGEAARVFGLSPFEAVFVDRIVLASVIVSAVNVWGEDLLPGLPIPPLRRLDVFKALFNFFNVTMMSAMAFWILPDATRYAMGILKHSLHSCYFCYHLKTAPLQEEIDFFDSRLGRQSILLDLLQRRQTYNRSFAFVLLCVPVLFRLHLRTAGDNRFPRVVTRT